MEVETNISARQRIRKVIFRVAKTTIKVVIVGVIYLLLSRTFGQVSALIPGLQEMIATFVIVYIALMVVCDLTSGLIIQHFFNGAKSLFVIAYFVFSLNSGILDYTFGNVNLMIDIRVFLILAMLFGLLGLAKSIIQAIDHVNEKLELTAI